MEQIRPFVDERLAAFCFRCHGHPATRDHVPPRVFLDRPYPENLPVVGSCRDCNEGASLDEEYAACLLEVAACGSIEPSELQRPKIAHKLTENPSLAARLAKSFGSDGWLAPEHDRVARVIEKIGRALWTFETGETTGMMSATVDFLPIATMPVETYMQFLAVPAPEILPEVNSRLMFRVFARGQPFNGFWQEVQTERFAYAIEILAGRKSVKMIVRDYLAAEVRLAFSAP